jgi:hypothetical protein
VAAADHSPRPLESGLLGCAIGNPAALLGELVALRRFQGE